MTAITACPQRHLHHDQASLSTPPLSIYWPCLCTIPIQLQRFFRWGTAVRRRAISLVAVRVLRGEWSVTLSLSLALVMLTPRISPMLKVFVPKYA